MMDLAHGQRVRHPCTGIKVLLSCYTPFSHDYSKILSLPSGYPETGTLPVQVPLVLLREVQDLRNHGRDLHLQVISCCFLSVLTC
ncbi:hypothetical protein TNCV_4266601 [Trichonephila clavipes]|nr:hypothetical protein TNCV_4266601 [Trichonephila clavipes]